MKGKKRLTQCEQKALVALKAEEIQEKARKAKQREKRREMSTAKVRTALGGQQMSFQPQPQVETAPLRYQPQQQERSRLSDPWIGFGQNVALTLLNYGLMQAGRHQDRQMLAALQQQKQQEKTVFKPEFKPEYKDMSLTDIQKGFAEISAIKKRKLDQTVTLTADGFKTPNKKNQSDRKKVTAKKSFGGLFDNIINRSTQSTQTETPSTQEFGTQAGSTQTQEFGTQTATEQDRRNAIDAMGFDDLLIALGEDNIHPDDKEYATKRAATLRSQIFAQNKQGQHFLETNTREQNKDFFDKTYRGGYIGSQSNVRGNVDPETGQTFLIIDGHRLNSDGSYELHPAGVLVQQTPDEAMAILKAVRQKKLEEFSDKFSKRSDLKKGFQAFVDNRGPVKGSIEYANPSELEENEQKTMDQWYNQIDESKFGPDRPTFVKPPPENATSLSSSLSDEELNDILNRQSINVTPNKPKFNKPDITPPTTQTPGSFINEIMRITGYTGVLPKMWLNTAMSVDKPTGDDLTKARGAPFKSWYNQDDESKMDITPIKPQYKKPDITPPPPGGYDPKKIIRALTNTVPNTPPPKNLVYAPSPSSLNQSPSTYGFFGPSAYPGTLDANVKGFFNKLFLKDKGGTPATSLMGSSPSSMMTPQTPQTSDVEMSSIITDQAINERPPLMQSFEIDEEPEEEEEEINNFGSRGFDNENIEDEIENVGSSFTGESDFTGYY